MLKLRLSGERGQANFGWLQSRHTFSFGEYHDPAYMGFRCLRVINEDRVAPGKGFDTHPHRDMEILSYVVSGELAHRDSLGNIHTVGAGGVQAMSAGTGVTHSEFNGSTAEAVHFLQVWIVPRAKGLAPRYGEWRAAVPAGSESWELIASPDGKNGSLLINQDAALWVGRLDAGAAREVAVSPGRGGWVQVISGELSLNSVALRAGDGVAVTDEPLLVLRATTPAHFLVFDLP